MRRITAWLLMLLCLLSGCAKKQEEPVTISVWTYYNGDQLTAFNQQVKRFNETVGAEQGIVVESSSYGSVNDLESSVLDAALGKVGAQEVPNIFGAYADTAFAVDQLGMLADLAPYFSSEELAEYVDGYILEGNFGGGDSIKIFPIAKSVELFLLNKTDWDAFAQATGAQYSDLATIEGVTRTAKAYYEWTDAQTPQPNDGKAFFGRDAMANYMIIGSMQLGVELIEEKDGQVKIHFDRDAARRLWDNYYVPFIRGYFDSTGRFRSDDVKTGNILAFVGSSSGATFFPSQVMRSDSESQSIEMEVFPAPKFEDAKDYAVQQGAGMAVINKSPREVEASVTFLKWFTGKEQNILFSVGSGYLPVLKSGNNMDTIRQTISDLSPSMEKILEAGVETVNSNTTYTPKAFAQGGEVRQVLEHAMSDAAIRDRKLVLERLNQGQSLEEATEAFIKEENFEAWYQEVLKRLGEFE